MVQHFLNFKFTLNILLTLTQLRLNKILNKSKHDLQTANNETIKNLPYLGVNLFGFYVLSAFTHVMDSLCLIKLGNHSKSN